MPKRTPFHDIVAPLCRDWSTAGDYFIPAAFSAAPEEEYDALCHAAGLSDDTGLYETTISGEAGGDFLSRVSATGVSDLPAGEMREALFLDPDGWVIDIGEIGRVSAATYRLCSTISLYGWISRFTAGYDVSVLETTGIRGLLYVGGPAAPGVISAALASGASPAAGRVTVDTVAGREVEACAAAEGGVFAYRIRTAASDAPAVWTAVMEAGASFRLQPAGAFARNRRRLEAGRPKAGVDFTAALFDPFREKGVTPERLNRRDLVRPGRGGSFVGSEALGRKRKNRDLPGIAGICFDAGEDGAYRPLPIRRGDFVAGCRGGDVGVITGADWSPLQKRNVALAMIEERYRRPGTPLFVEISENGARRWRPGRVRGHRRSL